MATLSGCTLVRNAVQLAYPLEASLQTYLPICDEVVIAYDPTSTDSTEELVKDLAARYRNIRLLASAWDMQNHCGGSEIAIQSNVALEACQMDWTLYVQADEAIHEDDHTAIRQLLEFQECSGVPFERRSFWRTLDCEITGHHVQGLLRLFRSGMAYAVGDGMTCRWVQAAEGRIGSTQLRLFNYSRMGQPDEVLSRSRSLHGFYHPDDAAVQEKLKEEKEPETRSFPIVKQPSAIRAWYGKFNSPLMVQKVPAARVTLAILLGAGERENFIPFLWPFRGWAGNVVIVDDETPAEDAHTLGTAVSTLLALSSDHLRIVRHPVGKDFGAARNLAHAAAASEWVLHADLDERWAPTFVRELPGIIDQMDRKGIVVCGFQRANVLDGVLVNDVLDLQWTEDGLARLSALPQWPVRNPDIQYRLLRREVRWIGSIHEKPAALEESPHQVAVLRDFWILHDKSLARQRVQDRRYRSLGQAIGMPQSGDEDHVREEPGR